MGAAAATPATTYRIASAALAGGLINAAINGALGWAMVPAGATLALWGLPGLALDVAAMCFGIAFGTGIGVTPILRSQAATGRVVAPPVSRFWRDGFANWPAGNLQRALNLGLLSTLVFAPPGLLLLWLGLTGLGLDGLEEAGTASFKAGFGLVHGAIVTPIIGLGALLGPRPDSERVTPPE